MTMFLAIVAAALNGLLAGASLDQSIKQLPARRRIGAVAYAHYARAADLGHGVLWYAVLGVGAALVTIGAGVSAYAQAMAGPRATCLFASAALAVLHTLATTRAAPIMLGQRALGDDEPALTLAFDRFERWQALRVSLQVLNFGVALAAVTLS